MPCVEGAPARPPPPSNSGGCCKYRSLSFDEMFLCTDLAPTPPQRWASLQFELAVSDRWVMDGDLGPYDVLEPRLARGHHRRPRLRLVRCLRRAARRSWARLDFWWWVITWRRRARPGLFVAVATYAPQADLHIASRHRMNCSNFFVAPGLEPSRRTNADRTRSPRWCRSCSAVRTTPCTAGSRTPRGQDQTTAGSGAPTDSAITLAARSTALRTGAGTVSNSETDISPSLSR